LAQAKRGVVSSPAPLAASLRLTSRFLPPDAQGIDLLVAPCGSAALPSKLQAAWSIGEQRGHAELQSTNKLFSFPLPVKLPALQPGESTDAIIDLRDGNRSAVFVLDLCRVRVLHFSGDTLAESVSAPSGATLAGFRLTRQGPVLLLEAEVTDSVIKSGEMWAFSRDGLNLFLDLRGANLFGGINPDTQVHQAFVNVYEKPLFAAALRPWPGA